MMRYYPLRAADMARTCRKLARDMRNEYAAGEPPIGLTAPGNQWIEERITISRLEAAERMEEQADRWLEEMRTGIPNAVDRSKLGMP